MRKNVKTNAAVKTKRANTVKAVVPPKAKRTRTRRVKMESAAKKAVGIVNTDVAARVIGIRSTIGKIKTEERLALDALEGLCNALGVRMVGCISATGAREVLKAAIADLDNLQADLSKELASQTEANKLSRSTLSILSILDLVKITESASKRG